MHIESVVYVLEQETLRRWFLHAVYGLRLTNNLQSQKSIVVNL